MPVLTTRATLLCCAFLTAASTGFSQSAAAALDAGDKAFTAGDFTTAEASFRQAIAADGKLGAAYYKLALTLLKTGKIEDGASNLRRAFTLNPENTDAGVKLAEIFILVLNQQPMRAGDFLPQIQEVADKLLERDPKSYDGIRLLAYLAIQNRSIPKGLEYYKAANQIKPNQTEILMPWAITLMGNQQGAEGERIALDLLQSHKDFPPVYDLLYGHYMRDKNLPAAEKIIKAKADNMPDHPEFRIQLASWYLLNKNKVAMNKELAAVQAAGAGGDGYVLVGDFYVSLREYDAAKKAFESCIPLGGKSKLTCQLRLVNMYSGQRRYAEATEWVNEALKENPANPEAMANRDSILVSSGDLAQIQTATEELKKLSASDPNNVLLHFELGRAYLTLAEKTRKPDTLALARNEEDAVLKLRPDFYRAKLVLAQMDLNAKEYVRALDRIDEVLKADPSNTQALLVRTSAWLSQQQYEKARTYLLRFVQETPVLADARFQLAECYRLQKDFANAEATYREMKKLAPGDDRVWMGIAQTLQDAKRYKEAIAVIQQEIAANPSSVAAHTRLGTMYRLDKQYEKSIEQLKIALQSEPASIDLHGGIDDAYKNLGNKQGVIDTIKESAELNPKEPEPQLAYAMALEEFGQPAEAVVRYEKILAEQPNNWIILNNLAYRKAEEGIDLDGALSQARKAHDLVPQVDTIMDTLAYVYIKKKMPDEAIKMLVELTEKDPNDASYRYHLALAYDIKLDHAKARQQCEVALSHMQAKPENAKYEAQIRSLLAKQ